nr:hypothetical protein [Tanacetum cinerariifolium]
KPDVKTTSFSMAISVCVYNMVFKRPIYTLVRVEANLRGPFELRKWVLNLRIIWLSFGSFGGDSSGPQLELFSGFQSEINLRRESKYCEEIAEHVLPLYSIVVLLTPHDCYGLGLVLLTPHDCSGPGLLLLTPRDCYGPGLVLLTWY